MLAPSIDELSSEQRLRKACAELARRIRAGEPATASEFLRDDSGLADNDDNAVELIYSEWVVRGATGERPSPESWLDSYPRWRTRLARLLELESALQLDTSIAAATLSGDSVSDEVDAGESYEVIRELGRGGMGVVHLARQVRLDRLVALKTILAGAYADAAADARFRNEAAAAARLQHPHIVQIFESGERAGHPFLSIEYVSGGTLADHLRAGPMSPKAAATLLQLLARAIGYAHDQGIVHRDLKPTNILLASGGGENAPGDLTCPKIADFGLAKTIHSNGDTTQPGAVVGTPSYMSPEQATAQRAGPPADIYALGAILYECLTGRPPFKGATQLDTLDQVRGMDPVPPRALQPAIPLDLETIALASLRKDPAKRYASAADLADDLQRFLDGRPIHARPVGVLEHGLKWCRRRPLASGLIAGIVALAASALVILAAFWQRAEIARQNELDQRIQAEERTGALAIVSARSNWRASNLEAARASLEQCPPAYRNEEWRYLSRASRAPALVIQEGDEDPGPETAFASRILYSPDGRSLAAMMRGGKIRTWDSSTGTGLYSYFDTSAPTAFAFPSADRIVIARLKSARAQVVTTPGRSRDTLGSISAIDFPTGQVSTILDSTSNYPDLSILTGGVGVVSLSNDGQFAVIGGPNVIQVVDLNARSERFRTQGGVLATNVSAFSDNGRYFGARAEKNSVAIWDIRAGRVVRSISANYGATVMSLAAVHPGGTHLALRHRSAHKKTTLVIRGESPDTATLIETAFSTVAHAIFSPDGRTIAARGSGDSFVSVWDATTGRELIELRGQRHNVNCIAFSPDGNHLAVGCVSGRIAIWDVSDLGDVAE